VLSGNFTWTSLLQISSIGDIDKQGGLMRIAVAGATGNIGARTVARLERDGHEVVRIARSAGVDLVTAEGLDDALVGVRAVVDTTNHDPGGRDASLEFFGAATRNLLAAEQRAGVGHHVLLSIVGLDRGGRTPHYAGKRVQEQLVEEGPVPWTILRATQFHDFAATVTSWTLEDGAATIAPLLVQPVAPDDVAEALAELAVDEPHRARIELAGPRTEALVDMARRTHAVRGDEIRLVPTWRGPFDVSVAGETLLPGDDARIGRTSFDDWLAAGAR
jgi:uncharacterized protein YbjT (DUF2867 family)